MNKQLLSFTALVAVGMLGVTGTAVAQKKMKASKPTIFVGGYMDQGVRFVDNADAIGGRDTGGFAAWRLIDFYRGTDGRSLFISRLLFVRRKHASAARRS